jgi:hypothetical protein
MGEKQEFLVSYDYGMGGLWGIVRAERAEQITERYPELEIMERPPEWLDEDRLARMKRDECHDIEDPPAGLLQTVVADRSR